MANVSVILGKSGTGKSTSIKTLNPKETIIINVLGKRLPFKGSNSLYNKENKNLFRLDDYTQVIKLLDEVNKQQQVKNVVIDDSIYILRKEYFSRARETGYGKSA